MSSKMTSFRPFIRNEFIKSGSIKQLINPSTRKALPVELHEASVTMADTAVTSARKALPNWSTASRRDILFNIARGLERRCDELAKLECLNGGKPIAQARADVHDCVEVFRYYAGFADKLYGKNIQLSPTLRASTLRVPVGVCGLITSYNYPLVLTSWKLAPALACGNTVLIKPHQLTPLSTLLMGLIIKDAGCPEGVFSILPGGSEIGNHLVKHMDVDKISFTGSGHVGQLIAQNSAKSNLKRITLELGGKSPLIVCADADLKRAAVDVCGAITANMGQNCCAGTRLYIQDTVHDEFLEMLKSELIKVQIGDPFDETKNFGPIVDEAQYSKIQSYIADAKDRKVSSLMEAHFDKVVKDLPGFYIPPTIFYGVDDSDKLAKEEIFGPVMTVLKPFKTIKEAITRANDSQYGLAAGVWTNNINTADMICQQLQAGTTWVNCYNYIHPSMPFGGLKQSGFGYDLGEEALLQEYTLSRTIYTERIE